MMQFEFTEFLRKLIGAPTAKQKPLREPGDRNPEQDYFATASDAPLWDPPYNKKTNDVGT